jgi:hypothetical protein
MEMPTMLAMTERPFAKLQSHELALGGKTAARSMNITIRPAVMSAMALPPIHTAALEALLRSISASMMPPPRPARKGVLAGGVGGGVISPSGQQCTVAQRFRTIEFVG